MASSSFFGGGNFPDYSGEFVSGKGGQSSGINTWAYEKNAPSFLDKGSKTDWRGIANLGANFLQKYLDKDQDKYRSEFSRTPFSMGGVDTRGFGGGQLLENLSVYSPPPSHAPYFIPGESGGPSGGQRFARAGAGALKGALSGFAVGGPVGAVVGAIGGGLSGGFG
jgi:hypothetical protein